MLLILITIFWFCFMTYLSHQSGKATTEFSNEIVEIIAKYFNLMSYENIHWIIRKLAHTFVFGIFTILVLFTLSQKYKIKKVFIFVIIFMILWTWMDEFTKLSIPGRHFSWYDVSLNFIGVIVGVLIFILFKKEK